MYSRLQWGQYLRDYLCISLQRRTFGMPMSGLWNWSNYFLNYLIGELPARMSMWQLRLRPTWQESDFDAEFEKFFNAATSHSTKWSVFFSQTFYILNQGGVTENFDFKINDDTEVYQSCSSVLNGEVFVFGGYNSSNNRKKQVKLNLR